MLVTVYDDNGNFLWSYKDIDSENCGDKIVDLLEWAKEDAIAHDVDGKK